MYVRCFFSCSHAVLPGRLSSFLLLVAALNMPSLDVYVMAANIMLADALRTSVEPAYLPSKRSCRQSSTVE